MGIQLLTTPLHLVWCWLFVTYLNYGVIGCAIATNITFYLNFLLITVYVSLYEKDISEAWFWPNKDCFIGLIDYENGIMTME